MRIVPNENSWIGIAATIADIHNPTAAEVAGALDVTDYVITINAGTTGNTVPTPSLKSLFETSIPGTASAQFTMDIYRDDVDDAAYEALQRNTVSYCLIKRFGGTGSDNKPAVGETVEVWPIHVSSRTNSAMSSNTAETATITASVPEEPDEDAVVHA